MTAAELAADAVHLLGVGKQHLLVSGECLYWFDVDTGRLRGRFPASFHAGPGHARPQPRGYGRGVLAGEYVYWPTREAIYVFDQRPVKTERGRPTPQQRIELGARGASGGNLQFANELLIIASADQLFAFECLETSGNGSGLRLGGRRETE